MLHIVFDTILQMKQCNICQTTENYYAKGMCRSCYHKQKWHEKYGKDPRRKMMAKINSRKGWLRNRERLSELRKQKRKEDPDNVRAYFREAQRLYRKRLKDKGTDDNELYLYGGIKKEVYQRDNYQCCDCYITQAEYLKKGHGRLHVHHIDNSGYGKPVAEKNNDINNLVTLCNACHKREHQRIAHGHAPRTLAEFKK